MQTMQALLFPFETSLILNISFVMKHLHNKETDSKRPVFVFEEMLFTRYNSKVKSRRIEPPAT